MNAVLDRVFVLLESIFQAFDQEARKAGVFKVETVGDCYVAVCGVPEACADHAEVMANFSRECLYQFNRVRVCGNSECCSSVDRWN